VVAGGSSIGPALSRASARAGYRAVLTLPDDGADPSNATAVEAFFARTRPAAVVVASVLSGGIAANARRPADFLEENLAADATVIAAAHRQRVTKLLYLGSSCMYPRECRQPMRVDDLMTGPLEPTSEAYAMAKLAGVALVRAYRRQHGDDFVAAVPADAFGPGDDFSDDGAHVVAALLRRLHESKEHAAPTATVWGTGRARRDFLFVDDLADACLFVLDRYSSDVPINIGAGADVSIAELAGAIREVVGFDGALAFDTTKPDGMPRKTLDAAPLRGLGWTPATTLRAGLTATYQWFLAHAATAAAPAPR